MKPEQPAVAGAVRQTNWLPGWLPVACWAWFMSILGGAILLTLPPALTVGGTMLSSQQALLAAASICTGNGFLSGRTLAEYSPFGRGVVLLLLAISTVMQLTVMGAALMRVSRRRMPDSQVALYAILLCLLVSAIGTAAGGDWSADHGVNGAILALSALANCGLSTAPVRQDLFLALLFPLSIVGMLGVFGLNEIWRGVRGRGMAPLVGQAGAWLAGGWLLMLCLLLVAAQTVMSSGAVETVALAATGRAYGVSVAGITLAEWPRWVVLVVGGGMFLGTLGTGGTGGGPGVLMWRSAVLGACKALGGLTGRRRRAGETVSSSALEFAVLALAAWAALWAITLGALLATVPQVLAERLWLMAATCVFSGGISFDMGVLSGPGVWVMAGAMIAGKALQVGLVWLWVADTAD